MSISNLKWTGFLHPQCDCIYTVLTYYICKLWAVSLDIQSREIDCDGSSLRKCFCTVLLCCSMAQAAIQHYMSRSLADPHSIQCYPKLLASWLYFTYFTYFTSQQKTLNVIFSCDDNRGVSNMTSSVSVVTNTRIVSGDLFGVCSRGASILFFRTSLKCFLCDGCILRRSGILF